ncbi:sigma-54-dependent transcriptional regulator [Polyangium fumosum]|uniref:Sigma-54-dependent Fis family transcriptional regulator n=1 Tax=Polyangium fumosum TaxID=889272 RepID=A0A4U1J704_9BACT|nr:sigma 54-interacting transcriptional regulator [Polyangium fumosum]TKD03102.1 sigma-54-dependent Fis family transcriptional regulator [Polyangium fumosum]
MNQRHILAFIDRLRKARTFEDAALTMLREMLDAAQAALAESGFSGRGRVLRGMAHWRPSDGYRRLVLLDDTQRSGEPAIHHLPSASAWRWVVTREGPIAIDVPLGRVWTWQNDAAKVLKEGGFSGQDSVLRLTSRDTSHLYAIPLRALHGAVEGMATVEAGCPRAVGEDFIFPALQESLELLAELAAPYLATLPPRPAAAGVTDDLLPVLGQSMAGLIDMLRVFALQEETLLIGGPTGAGKSRLARWCHARSVRRGAPFEVLDLIAVPEELQMAELFGWKKGAFTGAVRDTPGCITRAFKGTLFIDEIDKLSLKAQAGLLQLLESRTYRPIGDGAREQQANVRFIVGSNVDLYDQVKAGRFREDLYYRINVLPVKLPPLDERRDEIGEWARFMALRRHRESVPGGEARIAAGVERLLVEHTWPGNLRQLDNVVRRAYALALMTHGDAGPEILLEEKHFARALSYERGSERRSTLDDVRAAAVAVVEEAERQQGKGLVLDLELCDAFRGIVLGTAVERLGSKDAAFRLFGKGAQVQARNHHKMLRREVEKVEALCKALGEEGALFGTMGEEEG